MISNGLKQCLKPVSQETICMYLDAFLDEQEECIVKSHLAECSFCNANAQKIKEDHKLFVQYLKLKGELYSKIELFEKTWSNWKQQYTRSFCEILKEIPDKRIFGEIPDKSIYWVIKQDEGQIVFLLVSRDARLKGLSGALKVGELIKKFILLNSITEEGYIGHEIIFTSEEQSKLLPLNQWILQLKDEIQPEMIDALVTPQFTEPCLASLAHSDKEISVSDISAKLIETEYSVPLEVSSSLALGSTEKKIKKMLRQKELYRVLDELEKFGHYDSALQKIYEVWPTRKSWELLVRLGKYFDLLGKAKESFKVYRKYKNELVDVTVPPKIELQERFYRARLWGQLGYVDDAISLHKKNEPQQNELQNEERITNIDIFQVKSAMEIGHLLFRIEDFMESQKRFEQVLSYLPKQLSKESDRAYLELATDVYKFLATLKILRIIYDWPETTKAWTWPANNPEECLFYANKASEYAEWSSYVDGMVWVYTVKAFVSECLGNHKEAKKLYKVSQEIYKGGKARHNTGIYIFLYYSGFLRRQKLWNEAKIALKEAWRLISLQSGRFHRACYYQHAAYLAYKKRPRDKQRATNYFKKSMKIYTEDILFLSRDWPIVTRLSHTCSFYGVDVDQF